MYIGCWAFGGGLREVYEYAVLGVDASHVTIELSFFGFSWSISCGFEFCDDLDILC